MVFKILLVCVLITLCLGVLIILALYFRYEWRNHYRHQAPTISTYDSHYALMRQKLHIPDGSVLIDLGCGTGGFLRFMQRQYHCGHLAGVDNNRIALLRGRLLNYFSHNKQIKLLYGDITTVSLSEYDYIYLFLLPEHLRTLQPRLRQNMREDAIVICNTFTFAERKPSQEIWSDDRKTVLRLYQKNILS